MTLSTAMERGSTDATAQVLQIKQSGAQAVMGCLYQHELVILLRDMQKFAANAIVVGALGADFDQTVQQVGNPAAVRDKFFQPYQFKAKIGSPALKDMHDIFVKYLKKEELPKSGPPTNFYYFGVPIAIVTVDYVEGDPETYVLPLALSHAEAAEKTVADFPQALVAYVKPEPTTEVHWLLYDALYDPSCALALLEAIGARRRLAGRRGQITASPTKAYRRLRAAATDLTPTPSRAEQSNTSVTFGDALILKQFRRLQDGINPDAEITRDLESAEAVAICADDSTNSPRSRCMAASSGPARSESTRRCSSYKYWPWST